MAERHKQHLDRGSQLLAFQNCRLSLDEEGHASLLIDLEVGRGEFLLIVASDDTHLETFLDGALGLLTPTEGQVRFLDRSWTDMELEFAAACRGRIGSTLSEDDWLPYWGVLDNLLLPHLYHSRRRYDELRDEAVLWARRFGLPGVPTDLPANTMAEDRRRAGLIRAFLGMPPLILLDHRWDRSPHSLRTRVMNSAGEARQRGASIIWLTHDLTLSRDPTLGATRRLQLSGYGLQNLAVAA